VGEPRNELHLDANLGSRESLRFTPAGVPALGFTLSHASRQTEAGVPRQVECELQAVALGQAARLANAAPLGAAVRVSGFLAARSARSRQPVLHVTNIEFLEGEDHGIQTEIENEGQAR